jgi:hypothetical protein
MFNTDDSDMKSSPDKFRYRNFGQYEQISATGHEVIAPDASIAVTWLNHILEFCKNLELIVYDLFELLSERSQIEFSCITIVF